MRYLIEPYNAYQKPARKKHWSEIAEEEALYQKMMMEAEQRRQLEFQEALKQHLILREQSALKNNQNIALQSQQVPPSSQQIQYGQYAVNAGAGGTPPLSYFITQSENSEVANFSASPNSGVGPLAISFVNLTPTPENDTFLWDFGTGSLTSTDINPTSVTYTQTGSYTISLQATSSTGAKTLFTQSITVNKPTVTPALVADVTTGAAPLNVTFSNNTVYNGQGTLTYLWDFGSGSITSTKASPTMSYANPGTYTVSLQVTESSYKVSAKGTRTNYIVAT